jgi:GNAT superfamily N-acetyltransferase
MLALDGYGLIALPGVKPGQLDKFDCGTPHLNDFLQTTAFKMHEMRLGFTSVAFHRDIAGPLGYFTLANDALPLTATELFDMDIDNTEMPLKFFPAVKLGRLAVISDLQSQGVGAALIKLMLGEILDSSYVSSSRILIVDADNTEKVVSFYKRQGFEFSAFSQNQSRHMKGNAATVKMVRDVMKV